MSYYEVAFLPISVKLFSAHCWRTCSRWWRR